MSTTPECLDPTENPERRPPLTVAESILLKASITITKRNGDKGKGMLRNVGELFWQVWLFFLSEQQLLGHVYLGRTVYDTLKNVFKKCV
jgi:hypothetical protein